MSGMESIEHVVFLMLENRSFDNLLGWLYSDTDRPRHMVSRPGDSEPFHGLWAGGYANSLEGTSYPVQRGTSGMEVPNPDPHESYVYVNQQLFGSKDNPEPGTTPGMSGFLADYSTVRKDYIGPVISKEEALQILNTYTPEELPVINGLAREYAVCDMWFSSVPSQTNCNRAFSVCGTSLGLTDNAGFLGGAGKGFDTPTIWNVLNDNGRSSTSDWMIYVQESEFLRHFSFTRNLFPQLPDPDTHIAHFDQFQEAAENGVLPTFSYLEPAWFEGPFGNGNSYHPPSEVGPGEAFVKQVYDVLTSTEKAQKAWQKTLLIVTFDEHGGTYDHVPPQWGATPPWGDSPPEGMPLEHEFEFNRFGVRVPTLLISPWVEAGTVFRSPSEVPYDHTSFIATLLSWAGLTDRSQWGLGKRVEAAPTFDNALSRNTPRDDIPGVNSGPLSAEAKSETPISDLQLHLLPDVMQHLFPTKSLDEVASVASRISSEAKHLTHLKDLIKKAIN